TDAVISYHRVTAMAGQSVTLPCYYNGEVTSMCWGRGACPWLNCGTNIIWTDVYRVTYRRDGRYQLNGHIGGRDVSLTINNAALSDSGLYCCRIEVRGWFNDIKTTLELRVNPESQKMLVLYTCGRRLCVEKRLLTLCLQPNTLLKFSCSFHRGFPGGKWHLCYPFIYFHPVGQLLELHLKERMNIYIKMYKTRYTLLLFIIMKILLPV
ncbi:hypothetical protein FD754_025041, partial [Muntiacus muntjak]